MFTNFRMKMLNREAASSKNKSKEIIKTLKIQKCEIIVDIGSGGGYFTLEFSREVGDGGKVYAIDNNQKFLAFIEDESVKKGLENIETVLAGDNGFLLPEESVDLVFLRNVFHHLPEQSEYFKNIKKFLKSDGKLAILDYKKGGFSFTGFFGHFTPEEVLIGKLEKAGFSLSEKFDFLPDQSFMIFKKIMSD